MSAYSKPVVIWQEYESRRVVRGKDGNLEFEHSAGRDHMGGTIWLEVPRHEIKAEFTTFWIEVGKKFTGEA